MRHLASLFFMKEMIINNIIIQKNIYTERGKSKKRHFNDNPAEGLTDCVITNY